MLCKSPAPTAETPVKNPVESDGSTTWTALDRLAWVPSFDLDPMTSIETKRSLRHAALERDALLVFQHDPQVVAGRLEMGKRGAVVKPTISEEAWFDATAPRE